MAKMYGENLQKQGYLMSPERNVGARKQDRKGFRCNAI